jgi:hypothetical protein
MIWVLWCPVSCRLPEIWSICLRLCEECMVTNFNTSHKSVGLSRLPKTYGMRYKRDTQYTYNVTLRRVRESLLPWKSNQYYIFVCVCPGVWAYACAYVALLIQHATRIRHIVTSFVAPLAPPYFSTLSHLTARFSGKKVTEHKMCVFIFSTAFFLKHLILERI